MCFASNLVPWHYFFTNLSMQALTRTIHYVIIRRYLGTTTWLIVISIVSNVDFISHLRLTYNRAPTHTYNEFVSISPS